MSNTNNGLTICVLISCMHQTENIIKRTHVQTNVVVINQCDVENVRTWEFVNVKGEICHAIFISTTERGLSRSRNMAICNAMGDICIICDDDEELADGYEDIVANSYQKQPEAHLITFAFERSDKKYSAVHSKHNLQSLLRTSSVEITFRREAIYNNDIRFDEEMGSGTGNGAGEENMFLMTCRRKGLRMFYSPKIIGKLISTDSIWFNGYTTTYFENFGWATKRILGPFVSLIYLAYWITSHMSLYSKELSPIVASRYIMRGWGRKR